MRHVHYKKNNCEQEPNALKNITFYIPQSSFQPGRATAFFESRRLFAFWLAGVP